jgi:hypothetical protein
MITGARASVGSRRPGGVAHGQRWRRLVSADDQVSAGANPGQVTVHSELDARVRPLPGGLRALD